MGTLATVGALKPKNFIHVVFDNEVYGTTGNQPTISNVVPLEKVAKAAGYVNTVRVLDRDDLIYEFKDLLKKDGPSMLLVKVNEFQEEAERILLDPPDITKRFMKAIEG
jgi:thiamine pyrophosphate-dependent acetolactate synthase large subunit-like protein